MGRSVQVYMMNVDVSPSKYSTHTRISHKIKIKITTISAPPIEVGRHPQKVKENGTSQQYSMGLAYPRSKMF